MPDNRPLPYEGPDKYVFISYSHIDKENVYEDIKKLKSEGVRIWYDKGIPAGPEWDKYVYPKIVSNQCALVLFYVSENFYYSPALAKEIKIVFNTEGNEAGIKESFSVNFGGICAFDMFKNLKHMDQVLSENTKLLLEYFDSKKKFISRNNDDCSHIDEILENLARYDVIDEAFKYKLKKRDRKFHVLLVGKDSTFSRSIQSGAQDKFSSESDFHFLHELIDINKFKDPENQMLSIIKKHSKLIDGILIRPIKNISKPLITILEDLIKSGKRVILLDKDLSKSQKEAFKCSLPMFLASNFKLGGELIAKSIFDIIKKRKNENRKILILDGPKSIVSASQRVTSLKEKLQIYNEDLNTTIFIIDSFNVEQAISLLEQKLRYLYSKDVSFLSEMDLYLYLGNDNIAKKVIEIYKSDSDSYIKKYIEKAKNVIFIGYDGITDRKGNIDLFSYNVNAVTVDVQPINQGAAAADLMINALTQSQIIENQPLKPSLEENINMKHQRGKTLNNIETYLENKKYIVFDLDGTIANTEEIHFLSYQRILKKLGIDFVFDDFKSYIGNSKRKIWKMMRETYNLKYIIEDMIKLRTEIVLELFVENDLQPFNYFYNLLEKYPNVEKVILSSQIPVVIDFLMKKWNISNLFTNDRIVSVSDSKYDKGYVLANLPEVYPCIDKSVKPYDVVLFEDSNKTLKKAKDLDITTIGIEHKFNYHKLVNCDYIINEKISSGIFIGLAGIDIVHYQNQKLPKEDSKSKTDDFEVYVGGPAANAAITFAQLGGDATLLSCIGNSEIGKALKGMLTRYGVTIIDAISEESMTPNISSIIVNKLNGHRTIISGQKIYNDKAYKVNQNLLSSFDFVLYDCNAPQLFESNSENISNMNLILDAGSYKTHVPLALNLATEVISSNKFKENQLNIIDLKEKYNINFVAKTNGAEPIIYKINEVEKGIININKSDKVIDTLGAGDALHGAYCYYRYQEKLSYLDALTKASEYATMTVSHRGIVNKTNE